MKLIIILSLLLLPACTHLAVVGECWKVEGKDKNNVCEIPWWVR